MSALYPRTIGRYALHEPIASGGMATIHLGRLVGPVGFSKIVAIKRLHEHLASDPDFVEMFLDEARIAARINHPNVVSTLDIVELEKELFLVMDYVQGESLAFFIRTMRNHDRSIPVPIAAQIMSGVLHGLHAAHEATSEQGEPLHIIHRDVTPQNVLIGADGVARIADFGIATASNQLHQTREGQIKGKVQYMSPEQITNRTMDRRSDVYSASVVLWEALTGRKLFEAKNDAQTMYKVLEATYVAPSSVVASLPKSLDEVLLKGLQRDPARRYASAEEMALALEQAVPPITASAVGAWVREYSADALRKASENIKQAESSSIRAAALNPDRASRASLSSSPSSPGMTPLAADPASPPPAVSGVAPVPGEEAAPPAARAAPAAPAAPAARAATAAPDSPPASPGSDRVAEATATTSSEPAATRIPPARSEAVTLPAPAMSAEAVAAVAAAGPAVSAASLVASEAEASPSILDEPPAGERAAVDDPGQTGETTDTSRGLALDRAMLSSEPLAAEEWADDEEVRALRRPRHLRLVLGVMLGAALVLGAMVLRSVSAQADSAATSPPAASIGVVSASPASARQGASASPTEQGTPQAPPSASAAASAAGSPVPAGSTPPRSGKGKKSHGLYSRD
jgi:serine/threonine-protein kinase